MNVQQRGRFSRNTLVNRLVTLCLLCVLAGNLQAQESVQQTKIEVWEGLKKVGGNGSQEQVQEGPPQTAVPSLVPSINSEPTARVIPLTPPPPLAPEIIRQIPENSSELEPAGGVAPLPSTDPTLPNEGHGDNSRQHWLTTGVADWIKESSVVNALSKQLLGALRSGAAIVKAHARQEAMPEPTVATAVAQVAPASPAQASQSEGRQARPAEETLFYTALLVVCGLALLLGLAIVLRRAGLFGTPVVRIEVISRGDLSVRGEPGDGFSHTRYALSVGDPFLVAEEIGAGNTGQVASKEALVGLMPPADFVPQTFDLGPSFEEERLAREEAKHGQEQAMLQQIFEHNILLKKQTADLDTVSHAPRLGGETACPPSVNAENEAA